MGRSISPPLTKRRKTKIGPGETCTGEAWIPSPAPLPPSEAPSSAPSNPDTMRIFSWNINGITPFLQKSITSFFQAAPRSSTSKSAIPPASLRGFLHRHQWPAILFLQEVKISLRDAKTCDAVRAAVNAPFSTNKTKEPMYEAHFTLPNDPYNARGLRGSGKVYGVCSILRKDLRERYDVNVRTVDWDNEGRISVVELIARDKKLAVFNIYAVNGTENPYRDPKTGIEKGTRHDRKLMFHTLLKEECQALEKRGWHVLLGGDMNVAPDARDGFPKLRSRPEQHVRNRRHFHEKILAGLCGGESSTGLNGVDIWREMHGEDRRYTYYPRGREWGTSCDRVDYFVAGRSTWDSNMIKACDILDSEAERGPSDHVPIWVDVTSETEAREYER